MSAAEGVFEACIAAIPYAPATAFLAGEQAKLAAIPYSGPQRIGAGPGVGAHRARTARDRGWRSSPTASARRTA